MPRPADDQAAGDHPLSVNNAEHLFLRTFIRSLFPLLCGVSLSWGWQIPALYIVSGTDQSVTPRIIKYVFLGLIVACAVALLALPLLPTLQREQPVRNPLIRPLSPLVAKIILAILVVGLIVFHNASLIIIGATSFVYPFLCAARLGMVSRSLRWRIISLYSCLYLPFIWIFGNDVFQGAIKQGSFLFLPLLAGAPALLCSFVLHHFYGQQGAIPLLISVVVTGLEVLLGLWIIQFGIRRALAYQILLLTISIVTSFVFYALLRA